MIFKNSMRAVNKALTELSIASANNISILGNIYMLLGRINEFTPEIT